MSKRYARLYSDGSLGVCPDDRDLEQARRELTGSTDDDDTELVQVEVKIIQMFGQKLKPQIVKEFSAMCPCCNTEIFIDCPVNEIEDEDTNAVTK